MKQCKCCDESKPLESYTKKASSKDGHATVCKACKKIKDKAHYEENKESVKAKVMESYYKNPEPYKERAKNRRAKFKEADGVFYKADVDKLFSLQRGLCACCWVSLDDGYHVDHIMPLSLGGSNWPDNLQLLCPTCNLRKHAKDPFVWANEIGKLL